MQVPGLFCDLLSTSICDHSWFRRSSEPSCTARSFGGRINRLYVLTCSGLRVENARLFLKINLLFPDANFMPISLKGEFILC